MKKCSAHDLVALAVIAAIIGIFFFRLFFPVPQLIVTPDFGRSDSWHFSFATKYLLGENLHRNEIPLWTSQIGSGFPLFAEGQIGTFYIPNLVLFRTLDPVTAYNASLVLSLIIAGWGTYLWFRLMKYPAVLSFFAASTWTLSGVLITQLTHIALIEGLSLLPAVAAVTLLLARKKSWPIVIAWSVIASQQIFTGFPQASFITLIFSTAYYGWLIRKNPTKLADTGRFLVAIAVTVGLSAVQLLPSWEFLKQTTVAGGLEPDAASYFSYPFKHLVTLVAPFALGNPKMGTYPAFFRFDGSIFWENVGGIGLIPFLFLLVLLVCRSRIPKFFVALAGLSFLLMLGKYSPLYILYSFPPFNLFRVPSRFIWIFVLSLIALASQGISYLWQINRFQPMLRILVSATILFHVGLLFSTWYSYHAVEPAATWLALPEIITAIPKGELIRSIGAEAVHNQTFIPSGWQTTDPYRFLRSALTPNSNIYWDITNAQVYAGRSLARPAAMDTLISQELTFDEHAATVSALGKKLLNLGGVGTLIVALPLTQTGFTPQTSVSSGSTTITAWHNPTSLPRAYLATMPILATTKEQAYAALARDDFVPGESVLVETALPLSLGQKTTADVSLSNVRDTDITIFVKSNTQDALLVFTDTYYPGWSATLDGKQIPIFPANIQHMGVVVPQGDHVVRFRYTPASFSVGAWISAITLISLMGLWAFPLVSSWFHTRQKVLLRGARLRRSRGR